MLKSSASFTFRLRKLVITVIFLPFLRPVREKSQFYFFAMCRLQDFFHLGFVLIFFVSGALNRAALGTKMRD